VATQTGGNGRWVQCSLGWKEWWRTALKEGVWNVNSTHNNRNSEQEVQGKWPLFETRIVTLLEDNGIGYFFNSIFTVSVGLDWLCLVSMCCGSEWALLCILDAYSLQSRWSCSGKKHFSWKH
jgi:hypothetical protein